MREVLRPILWVYLFFLYTFSSALGLVILVSTQAPILLYKSYPYPITKPLSIFGLSVALLLFLRWLFRSLQKQNVHLSKSRSEKGSLNELINLNINKTSYIQFVWFGVILSPLIALVNASTYLAMFGLDIQINGIWAILLSLLFFGAFLGTGGREPKWDTLYRFSPGSIPKAKDEFDYAPVATGEMGKISTSNHHIIVSMLNGEMGWGKSSFLRMMVESLEPSSFLYTYISLTETNEAESFSKLFAERWSRSIVERYPSIVHSAKQSVIENIARESNDKWSHIVRSLINEPRWPLRRTVVKQDGDNYPARKFLYKKGASLFSHVPYFFENYWVIVIDEVERAPFFEVYRMIETIERFRAEAQWGLPLKLVFILCVDRQILSERMDALKDNEYGALVKTFFFDSPKTIDEIIELPPINPKTKEQFIKRRIQGIVDKYKISIEGLKSENTQRDPLSIFWPMDTLDRVNLKQGRLEDRKAYDYAMNLLLLESPRTIVRVIDEATLFLNQFIQSQQRQADQIRLSDIILYIYLKIRYPSAIEFIKNILPKVFSDYFEDSPYEASFMRGLMSDANKDLTFITIFKQHTSRAISEKQISKIQSVLSYLCPPILVYVEYLKSENARLDYEGASKPNYDRTLGLPENMWDFLTIGTIDDTRRSDYLETQRLEIEIRDKDKVPTEINSSDKLLSLARNMRRFYSGDAPASKVIAEEIVKRLSSPRRVKKSVGALYHDTVYNDLTFLLLFHVSNYVKRDNATDDDIQHAYGLVKQFLESSNVLLGAKIIFIDSLINKSLQPTSEIEIDLSRTREKLELRYPNSLQRLVRKVMTHGLDTYLPKGPRNIYDVEENFFYVLYQMWDGDIANNRGVQMLSQIALKDLEHRPKVIDSYWQRLRQPAGSAIGISNVSLYIPITLKQLIDVTRKARLSKRYASDIAEWELRIKKKDLPPLTTPTGRIDITAKQGAMQYCESGLKIIKATYGVDGKYKDVLSVTRSSVKNNQLTIVVDNSIFGDPAPGEKKNLTVRYRYNGKAFEKTAHEYEKFTIP